MTTVAQRSCLVEAIDQVTAELARWHVPGAEIAVVRDGEPLFAGGIGTRGVDDHAAVGSGTLFHHGSCGKAFTGVLAALLAEAGVLDLDAPVARYVPGLRLPDPVIAARVTMRDLLCHRSGLGRHDMVWILDPTLTGSDLVARLPHLPMVGDLRNQWSYSNLGYTLAGHAMERVTGGSWHELLTARVLEPLGLARTLTSIADAAADPDHATPHVLRHDEPHVTAWRQDRAIAPAGALISCADDSVRWLLAQLGQSGTLPEKAIRAAQRAAIPLPADASRFLEIDFAGYGLGWISGSYRDHPLVWHNGGVDGFTTQTLLLPKDRVGIVVCANQHLTDFALAAVLAVADALLGVHAEASWFDRLRPAAAERPEEISAPPSPPSHTLAAYAGTFHHAGYGKMRVTTTGDGLSVRLCGSDVQAKHRHFDTWTLHYAPLDQRFPVTFQADASGEIMHAEVEFEPVSPIRFSRQPEATG